MNERQLMISGQGQNPREISAGLQFKDISDVDLRVALRAGDILTSAAFNTDCVQKALTHRREPLERIVGTGDLAELAPSLVIQRVKDLVGTRGAIKVVETAMDNIVRLSELNGDRELVEERIRAIQEDLSEDRRIQRLRAVMNQESELSRRGKRIEKQVRQIVVESMAREPAS